MTSMGFKTNESSGAVTTPKIDGLEWE